MATGRFRQSMSRDFSPLLTILKWALAVLATLVVLLILIVELMPLNFLKGPITDRVEAITGREMNIAGDVSVSLLPQPQISLNGVELANPDWAEYPQMLSIEQVMIESSLTSLIRGELALDEVAIVQPVLNLENRAAKPANWVLPAMMASGETGGGGRNGDRATEEQAEPTTESSITVHQITVNDAKIRYLAAGAEHPVVPIELSATVDPGFTDSRWRLSDLQAKAGEVRISGNLGVDAGATPMVVTGKLRSPTINVSRILAAMPDSRSAKPATVSVPVLPNLAGEIHLNVGQLILEPARFDNVQATLRPGRHQLVLEPLNFSVASGKGKASARLTSNAEFITAGASLDLQNINLQALGLELPGQIVSAELDLALDRIQQAPSVGLKPLLAHLDIGVATAAYRTEQQNPGAVSETDLKFALEEFGDPLTPVLSVIGQFQGRPLDMTIEGAALTQLAGNLADYGLQAQAQSGGLTVWADTRLGAILSPATFSGKLVLKGDGGQDLEAWTEATLPPLPEFRFSGRLSRDGQLWSAASLDGHIGVTELSGDVQFRHADRPVVNVDIQAGRIDLAQFTEQGTPAGEPPESEVSATNDSPLAFLQTFNGELNLSADTLVLPDTPELKDLKLAANLDEGRLRIEPLNFDVAGGSWASTMVLDATSQPASGTLDANFEAIALSQFGNTFTPLEERLGELSGELHLGAKATLPVDQRKDLLLPFIGHLTVEPSWLTFTDPEAATDITFRLHSQALDNGDQAFHIDGEGQYDDSPFSLQFKGGPLLAARDPDRPYALELSSRVVNSRIHARGTVQQPLALKGLDLALELEGPNPHRLTRLLGVPLPNLPPYSASGDLSLKGQQWRFSGIQGTVGDSDLSGRVAFDTGVQPPRFTGELHSRSMDLADLGFLAGADSTDAPAEDRYVLPDQAVITAAWQEVSADVRYRAEAVRAADVPFSGFVLDFELEDGNARFEPVSFGLGEGQVDFTLLVDTKKTPPDGTLEVEVQGVNLKRALRNWPMVSDSVGIVGGQGKFWVAGNSLADLIGSADGGLVMLMTQGRLDALMVEMAGLDFAESFLAWLGSESTTPINCAYIDLLARDGVASIDTLAVDTADTRFTGTGTINLSAERLDLTIFAHPKDASALSANSPLHLGGTFNKPELGVQTGNLALQAGSSVVLAALTAPFAAVLPLLDLGTGDELRYCSGLVSRSLDAIEDPSESEDEPDNDED